MYWVMLIGVEKEHKANACRSKLRIFWEKAKKSDEKFGGNGKNVYLCTIEPTIA